MARRAGYARRSVANVLVLIELVGDRPSEASLECLGEARRIASFLGATLSAVLPCASPPVYGDDDVFAVLGRHGADKVVLVAAAELAAPALWATHGSALSMVCEKVPPSLFLAAATAEFARYGLGGARVDRIAARANANKRMLYYYYGNKEALFLAVMEAPGPGTEGGER